MKNFIESDPRQPLLLPVDLREWVPEDDLAHFVLAAVERVPMSAFHFSERGRGKAQYHPRTMLALLIYSYANGIFGSRRIERATYRDLGTRFICADVHPDHDTICRFRRENFEAVSSAFLEVLMLASELKLLKVGVVSVDGTKMDANASKRRSIRYDRAKALREKLQADIAELLEQAESADNTQGIDEQALPKALARREALEAALSEAQSRLEAEAKARAQAQRGEYERKVAERDSKPGRKGPPPKPPSETPRDKDQTNLTDPDSRLMRKNKESEFRQAYNAQAAVDAGGSQLIVGMDISQSPSDARELANVVAAIPQALGKPALVLADSGYANENQVQALKNAGITSLVAMSGGSRQRPYDFRPPKDKPERQPSKSPPTWRQQMQALLDSPEGRALYRLRQQTVEPVFGIVRAAMGFTHFHLRGVEKVAGEWSLVGLAYNVRRVHRLMAMSGA